MRVFCNEKGNFGNPVGIIEDLDNKKNIKTRKHLALTSGFSEIVFIDNLGNIEISIFSPSGQIPFAGHAAVGLSYYIRHEHKLLFGEFVSMGETIETWEKDGITWVKTDVAALPDWNLKQFRSSGDLENLTLENTSNLKHTLTWSWIDERDGLIRARTFASDWGIPEDEANGSGAIKLSRELDREIVVHHGKGSVIRATPNSVGGLVNNAS